MCLFLLKQSKKQYAMTTTKKITLATVKSFVRKNSERLFINVKSSFCGYTDCVERVNGDFAKATKANPVNDSYTLGIAGAWFVGQSRDYFRPFENEKYTGVEVYNSCGSFILAVEK
jgi:hypothetical protein